MRHIHLANSPTHVTNSKSHLKCLESNLLSTNHELNAPSTSRKLAHTCHGLNESYLDNIHSSRTVCVVYILRTRPHMSRTQFVISRPHDNIHSYELHVSSTSRELAHTCHELNESSYMSPPQDNIHSSGTICVGYISRTRPHMSRTQ